MSEKKQRRKNSVTSFLFQEQQKSTGRFMQQSMHINTKKQNEFINVSSLSGFSEKNRHKSKSFLKNKKNLRIQDENGKTSERTIDLFQNKKQDYYIKGIPSQDYQNNKTLPNEELFTLRNKNYQATSNDFKKNILTQDNSQTKVIQSQLQQKQDEFESLNKKFQQVISENQDLEKQVDQLQNKIQKQNKEQKEIMEFFKEMEQEKENINESIKNIQEKEQQVAIHAETIIILKNNLKEVKNQLQIQITKNQDYKNALEDSQQQSSDFKSKIQDLLQIQKQTEIEKKKLIEQLEIEKKNSDQVKNCSSNNVDQIQTLLTKFFQFLNLDQENYDFQNFKQEDFDSITDKVYKKLKTVKFINEEDKFQNDFLKYLNEFFQNLIKLLQLSDQDKNEFHFEEVVNDIERQYCMLDNHLQKVFEERESFEKRVSGLVDFKNHIRKNIDKVLEVSENALSIQNICDQSFLNKLEEEEQYEHQQDFEIIINRFYKLEQFLKEKNSIQKKQTNNKDNEQYIQELKQQIESFKKLTDSMEKELDEMETKLNEYKKTIYQLQQENQDLQHKNDQNLSLFDRGSIDSRMRQSVLTYKSNQSDKENIPIQVDEQRTNFIQQDQNETEEEDNSQDEEDLISQIRTSIGPNETLGDLPEMILNSDDQKDIKLLVIETFKLFLKKNQTWQIQCDKLKDENQNLKNEIKDKEIYLKKMKIEQLKIPQLEKQIQEYQNNLLKSESKMKSTIDTQFNQSHIGKFKEILIEAIEAPLELQEENMITFIDLAQKHFKMLKQKINSLQQINQNLKQESEHDKQKIQTLNKNLNDSQIENQEIKKLITKLEAQSNKKNNLNTSLDDKAINDLKQENQQISQALIQMKRKFDILSIEKNQLYKTFQSLKENFSKMSYNYMKLENEYNLANEDNKRLEEHLSKVNDVLQSKTNEDSIKKVKYLNEENQTLQQSLLMLSQKIDVSSVKCVELEEEIKLKDKENKQFLDERRSLLKKLQKFASLSALKTEECEEKTLRLSKALLNLAMIKSELHRVSKNNSKFNQFFSQLFSDIQKNLNVKNACNIIEKKSQSQKTNKGSKEKKKQALQRIRFTQNQQQIKEIIEKRNSSVKKTLQEFQRQYFYRKNDRDQLNIQKKD